MEFEYVRHSSCDGVERVAAYEIGIHFTAAGCDGHTKNSGILGCRYADEDACTASDHARWPDSGVLEGFPADLEYDPLLRIHVVGFPRRYSEEFRIELIDVGEERAVPAIHLTGGIRIRIVIIVDIPSLGGHYGNKVRALHEHI